VSSDRNRAGKPPPKVSRYLEITARQRSDIDQLLARWNRIQGQLKRAEQISQSAVIPAVNELRYAGRLLVGVMSRVEGTEENGLPSIDEAIITSSQYLTNAEHDISDALIYFYQKKVDDLNLRYGAKAIAGEFPEYQNIVGWLKEARNLVIESRANLSERKRRYQEIREITDKITKNFFILIDSEVLFALEVEHYNSRILFWKVVSASIFLASALAAAAIWIW
tara:strand:+ start:278 stop:946 length:669 start_codon:yes stop_codon:yes gene_type:complete